LVAVAVAIAGWRTVIGVVVPLLIAARATLGHRLGWPTASLSVLAMFVSGVFAVGVVRRAVIDGAPVVDVLLPLIVVVGASMMLFGIVRPGTRPLR
jgi:hypothetical protein